MVLGVLSVLVRGTGWDIRYEVLSAISKTTALAAVNLTRCNILSEHPFQEASPSTLHYLSSMSAERMIWNPQGRCGLRQSVDCTIGDTMTTVLTTYLLTRKNTFLEEII